MASIVLSNHAPQAAVARSAQGAKSAADLMRDAARVAARLPPAVPGSHVVLAITGDRYALAAAWLGAAARGHAVALPPAVTQPWLGRLGSRADSVAVIHDGSSSAGLQITRCLAEAEPCAALSPDALQLTQQTVTLHQGDGWRDARSLSIDGAVLLAEAHAAAEVLELGLGASVASSLPLGGRYDLVCGVLLPLLYGGSFGREVVSTPESLCGRQADLLLTTPSHLRRLARADASRLGAYGQILCSRGALTDAVVAACAPRVTDLFGSTELGSVGFRRAGAHGFAPLTGVELEIEASGQLRIDSPYLARERVAPYASDELAVACGSGFDPLGKRGRVVGEGERRLSLERLAEQLCATLGVEDAVIVAPPASAATAPELLVAVRAEPGLEPLFCEHLLAACPATWPPPRVSLVPGPIRSRAGRPLSDDVFRHFGLGPEGEALQLALSFSAAQASSDGSVQRRSYRVAIPVNYAYFEGHFPGYPILPGAAQLSELVLPSVRRARPGLGRLQHMTRVKFMARIEPGDVVELILRWHPQLPVVEFELRRGQTLCAGGKLGFSPVESST